MAPFHSIRGAWSTFLMGSLFGFFAGSTLFSGLSLHTSMFSNENTHAIEVTTHALRALASLRHFPEINGWGLVHVFYGNNSHLPTSPTSANQVSVSHNSNWFGQFQQDYFVSRVLNHKQGGFFVDLSAGHAFESSKTYALETHYGWNGLCVEADPQYWEGLSLRKCDLVGAIVGENRVEDRANRNPTFTTRLHYAVPLREILERFESPRVIDYLSVNDNQHDVFLNFPFDRYRFNVITTERPTTELQATLVIHGYIKLFEFGHSEMLWIHQSRQYTVVDREAVSKEAENWVTNDVPPEVA